MKLFLYIAIGIVAIVSVIGFYVISTQPVSHRVPDITKPNEPVPIPQPTPEPTPQPQPGYPIVETPIKDQSVGSPLVVRGSAPGTWYFEANFPIELKDENGKQLAMVPVQAQGEWMTTDYVPFEVSIPFTVTKQQKGTLILHKDNPSGLPEHDKSMEIPVILEP